MENGYLESVKKQFEYYKLLGDKTMAQLSAEQLFWQYNPESNSIATIVKHLWGNMLSRWTDFLTSDGEKDWRDRDAEFENDIATKEELLQKWEAGWKCFFDALNSLKESDLAKEIYIRNQGHTVMEAINRQLAHYPYHIGQMVFVGKMICNEQWKSLSIPKGNSKQFNADKFAQPKHKQHFTEEFLRQKLSKNQLIEMLQKQHQAFWEAAKAIPAAAQHRSDNGKWSVAQNLEHINKSIEPVAKFLTYPKAVIQEKFGLTHRASMSFDELRERYNTKIREDKVVAPPTFAAAEGLQEPIEKLAENGQRVLANLVQALEQWTEQELEDFVCPHPVLGKLTVREMLLFSVFHCQHHQESVERYA